MLLRFHLSTLRHPWFCWCLGAGQATGHYPNEWWPGSLTYVYVYRPQRVNSNWTWITTRWLFHWKSLRIFVLIAFTLFNAYFCSNIWGHYLTWWRHQMKAYSALLALYAGNSPFTGEFPSQGPVTRSFDVFFDLHQSKRLSKQSWGWWFQTPLCSLWRHCNGQPRSVGRFSYGQEWVTFADDIFKSLLLRKLFLTDNFDLCCCCVGANNNMPSLLRLVSWRRTGDMPLPELMMLLPHFEVLVLK